MTRKQFFSLRKQLMVKLMEQNRSNNLPYSFRYINRMDIPMFGSTMTNGNILRTYDQCWESMLPLRQAVGFDN